MREQLQLICLDPPSTTISAHFEESDTACAYHDYWITEQGCPT